MHGIVFCLLSGILSVLVKSQVLIKFPPSGLSASTTEIYNITYSARGGPPDSTRSHSAWSAFDRDVSQTKYCSDWSLADSAGYVGDCTLVINPTCEAITATNGVTYQRDFLQLYTSVPRAVRRIDLYQANWYDTFLILGSKNLSTWEVIEKRTNSGQYLGMDGYRTVMLSGSVAKYRYIRLIPMQLYVNNWQICVNDIVFYDYACAANAVVDADGNCVCPAGFWGDGYACTACAAGTYSKDSTSCVACPSGTYATIVGASTFSVCTACASGTFASAVGSSTCSKCVINSNSSSGASACSCLQGVFDTNGNCMPVCGALSTIRDPPARISYTIVTVGTSYTQIKDVFNNTVIQIPYDMFASFMIANNKIYYGTGMDVKVYDLINLNTSKLFTYSTDVRYFAWNYRENVLYWYGFGDKSIFKFSGNSVLNVIPLSTYQNQLCEFRNIQHVIFDDEGIFMYLVDPSFSNIYKINIGSKQCSFLNIYNVQGGYVDGPVAQARFNTPRNLLYWKNFLFVADYGNNVIRRIDIQNNVVSTFAVVPMVSVLVLDGNKMYAKTSHDSPFQFTTTTSNNKLYIFDLLSSSLLDVRNVSVSRAMQVSDLKYCEPNTYSYDSMCYRCKQCTPGYVCTNFTETMCPVSTYSVNGARCESCSIGTYASAPGLASVEKCVNCSQGFFSSSPGSTTCFVCTNGTYNAAPGQSSCSPCPSNSWCASGTRNSCPWHALSAPLSVSQHACLCEPGYAGDGSISGTSPCALCWPGFYCPGGNGNLSVACPANSMSMPGAQNISACTCNDGYVAAGNNTCVCAPNRFCSSNASSACPANSTSPPGATSVSACVCDPGFYRASSTQCAQCPVGFYCSNQTKTACTGNATTPSVRSIKATECFCDRGFVGVNNSACRPCPANSWCWTGVANLCPSNTVVPPLSSYMSNCTCAPGYAGPPAGPCTACTSNSFCEAGGVATRCPPYSVSGVGATSIDNCSCLENFVKVQNTCVCREGYFLSQGSCVQCAACTANAFMVADCLLNSSRDTRQCRCNPGYGGNGFTCAACAPGAYELNNQCIQCGSGSYSNTSAATLCTVCVPGSYSNTSAATLCVACVPGSYSNASAASKCGTCAPGSYQSASAATLCTVCVPGSYSNTSAATLCTACVPGSYSSASATTTCLLCTSGSYSSTNTATLCTACAPGSYSNTSAATVCRACAPGSYSDTSATTKCTVCAPGSYASAAGSATCAPCATQTYSSATGATACVACLGCSPFGSLVRACNATRNNPICGCAPGYWGDGFNCTLCATCPLFAHPVTVCQSTSDYVKCECDAGFFGNGKVCEPCSQCDYNGNLVAACNGTADTVCACNAGFSGDGFSCSEDRTVLKTVVIGLTIGVPVVILVIDIFIVGTLSTAIGISVVVLSVAAIGVPGYFFFDMIRSSFASI